MDSLLEIKQIILTVIKDNLKINDFALNKNQVYVFTNENIAGYIRDLDLNGGVNALSVCSGGDHLLNLGVKDVLDVDLVDINPITEYFTLGIKLPLILAYSYEGFKKVIEFLFKSKIYNLTLERKILYGLLAFMPTKYKLFFKKIFDYYFALQDKYQAPVKLMQILTTDYYFNLEEITFYNLYLQSEESYNRLKANIRKMNLSFQLGSIFDYDLVLCSNALEHIYIPECDMAKLKAKFAKLKNSLTDDGKIIATYMYGFYDKASDSYENYPIKGTDIYLREVLKEELILLDSYKKSKDAVLVLKKQKNPFKD